MLLSYRSFLQGYLLEKNVFLGLLDIPSYIPVVGRGSAEAGLGWHLAPLLAVRSIWSADAFFLLAGIYFHIFLWVWFWLFSSCSPVIPGAAAFLQLSGTFQLSYSNVLSQEFVRSVENYSSEKYFCLLFIVESFHRSKNPVKLKQSLCRVDVCFDLQRGKDHRKRRPI